MHREEEIEAEINECGGRAFGRVDYALANGGAFGEINEWGSKQLRLQRLQTLFFLIWIGRGRRLEGGWWWWWWK